MNPFLGYRAIRVQLDQKKLLITQARALLRASAYGNLGINLPMIATVDEFLEVKEVFKKVENDLKKEGIKIGKYQLGIMVEIPSTVILADKFAKYSDFFSIGTNDLIQYTFAVDRMSKSVSYLYQPFNPAILKSIKTVIDSSHKYNK
jgi:phosphotransferase system enzyme I (PtsI)